MDKLKFYFIQGISIFLGFTFWGAGMAKLFYEHQFFGWIGPVWLIEELAAYGLGLYGVFIAYSQIIIGYLMVTTRYKLLGSIMMIPLIGNILMVTISLNWKGTPIVLGFLMLLNLFILWQYKDYFRPLIDESTVSHSVKERAVRTTSAHLVWLAGLSLQIISIQISFINWIMACSVVIVGLFLSYLSFRIDEKSVIIPKLEDTINQ